jgi:uncharacterized DUF497 family protein
LLESHLVSDSVRVVLTARMERWGGGGSRIFISKEGKRFVGVDCIHAQKKANAETAVSTKHREVRSFVSFIHIQHAVRLISSRRQSSSNLQSYMQR